MGEEQRRGGGTRKGVGSRKGQGTSGGCLLPCEGSGMGRACHHTCGSHGWWWGAGCHLLIVVVVCARGMGVVMGCGQGW